MSDPHNESDPDLHKSSPTNNLKDGSKAKHPRKPKRKLTAKEKAVKIAAAARAKYKHYAEKLEQEDYQEKPASTDNQEPAAQHKKLFDVVAAAAYKKKITDTIKLVKPKTPPPAQSFPQSLFKLVIPEKLKKRKADRHDLDAWIKSGLFEKSQLNRKKFLHDEPIGLKHTYIEYHYEVVPIQIPLIVRLNYWFTNIWEWCMVVTTVISFYLLTYTSCFQFFQLEIFYTVFGIDMIFLCDALFRNGLEVWRYLQDIPCVVLVSPYTIISFLADVISIIPLERIFIFVVGTENLTYLGYYDFFRYNRILRFTRIFNFLSVAVKERRISEKLKFFMQYFLIYIGFIQICACIFHLSLQLSPMNILLQIKPALNETWLDNMETIKPGFTQSPVDFYTLAIYFSTSVVTTTGYGELEAHSILEMIFCIVVMLFGSIIFPGLFQSGLTNFELKIDGARFDMFFRLAAVAKHLDEIKASALFKRKVMEYYPLLWNFREGVLNVPFFTELPRSMQGDIKYDYCQEMFHKSALFRGLDASFLRAVASKVQVVITNPEMLLFAQGDYAMKMYYIIQGEVVAKSKFRTSEIGRKTGGAVIRAGCIIGEINLFFSYPYSTEVWTRTCCQLLKIEKEDLLSMLDHYPTILELFRTRVQRRFNDLHNFHTLVGHEPILWVEAKDSLGFMTGKELPKNDFPVIMRWGSFFRKLNRVVREDVIDDSQGFVIVDMPCLDPTFAKSHTRVYETSLVPNILAAEAAWVHFWVGFTMLLAMFTAFIEPYCLCFNAGSGIAQVVCEFDWNIEYIWLCYYIFDIFVEITQSAPSTGLYYQIVDGLKIRSKHIWFYVDLVAAVPLIAVVDWVDSVQTRHNLHVATVCLRCTKLWKVFRYFNYLDNAHPSKLFYFRLIQTIIVLLFATHFLACMYFYIACPAASRRDRPICKKSSWLSSYHIFDDSDEKKNYQYLGRSMPYLLSFYFACATLSSAGFGDFVSQNPQECYGTIIFCLISFYIICYYTAILTSALSCTVRAKLTFENKLTSVRQFMDHYGINETLQQRVLEHYQLQSQLWHGVTLPMDTVHYLYDTPEYLQDDALYIEVEELFDGVPIFSKLDPKLIVKISKLIRRYLIPPGVVFLRRAEVRRQMYIIGKGSVGIFADGVNTPLQVLEASCHFGIRDLMLGEPAHHHIKTLSHCLIYEVELRDLKYVLDKEPGLAELISQTKEAMQDHIDAMVLEYSHRRSSVQEAVRETKSWIQMPTKKNPIVDNCTYNEYEEFFDSVRFGSIFRLILLPKTVNPTGNFAKIWTMYMSIISYLQIVTIVTESFLSVRSPWFRVFQYILDLNNMMDIYIRLHWAYYNEKNRLLVSHPLMTAIHYVFDGGFCYDILFCCPFELMMVVSGASDFLGYSGAVYWYSKLRWTRIGQILRLPAVIKICHNIFTARSSVLCILYVTMTLFLCTALAACASYIACPSAQARWKRNHTSMLPFCSKDSWATTKGGNAIKAYRERWIMGVYYVSQVILVIGFGDMIQLRESEIVFLIFMMLFGFIIIRCVLSDITAAEVELDEARLDFLEDMQRLKLIMNRERVRPSLVTCVVKHLTRTWDMSKGLQPKQLFADLHPALQSDVYRNFVGEQLISVPIFNGLTENVIRTLCQYLTKVFFLKGERLMRHGNLECEMYIIVDGKVWIADHDLNWVCTIQTGETFGETSMLMGSRRRYNAIAGSHVEVFALTSAGFEELLERYPVVESSLTRKLSNFGNRDLFERLITARLMDADLIEAQTKKIKTVLLEKDEYDVDTENPLPPPQVSFFTRRIWGYGPSDEHLPFLYFATTKNNKMKLLIHPKCLFMRSFMMLVLVLSVITPAFGVLYACFSGTGPSTNLLSINWVRYLAIAMELPMYFKILFKFITPFEVENKVYCKVFRIIAYNYGTSFSYFWMDLISSFPVYLVIEAHPDFRYLGILRCLRLVHFYRVQFSRKNELNRSTFRYKVSISVISFMLMAHLLACIFYYLSPCACPVASQRTEGLDCTNYVDPTTKRRTCNPQTWTFDYIGNNGMDPTNPKRFETWRWYIRSLYWVVTTISTTGFGGITPVSIPETLLAIVCIFCGSFVLSIILSHFTSGIASLTKTHRGYLYQVDILTKHYSNIGMSKLRRSEINAYFLGLWDSCRGVAYHKTTAILPVTMRIEVCHSLYYQVLGETRLFQPYHDKAFLRQLCSRVEHSYILPGTNIVCQGDTGSCLFIVFRGTVAGYTVQDGIMVPQTAYSVSECFGKDAAFFYDSAYNKSYRAETDVEVLTLSQREILTLATYFQDFSYALQTHIASKFETREGRICIFEMEHAKEPEPEVNHVKKHQTRKEQKKSAAKLLAEITKKEKQKELEKKKRVKRGRSASRANALREVDSDESINEQAELRKLMIQRGEEYLKAFGPPEEANKLKHHHHRGGRKGHGKNNGGTKIKTKTKGREKESTNQTRANRKPKPGNISWQQFW